MKTLHFESRSSFLNELDGKIYAVCDHDGHYLCDILEEDYVKLTNEGMLVDLTEDMDYSRIDAESDVVFKSDVGTKGYEDFKEKYGIIIEIDKKCKPIDEAIEYVRKHVDMDEVRLTIKQMDVMRYPLSVVNPQLFDTIYDTMEEYGQDNDLPEGWWFDEEEVESILFKL